MAARIVWGTALPPSDFDNVAPSKEGIFTIICESDLHDKFLMDRQTVPICIAFAAIQDLLDTTPEDTVQKKLGAIMSALLFQRFGPGEALRIQPISKDLALLLFLMVLCTANTWHPAFEPFQHNRGCPAGGVGQIRDIVPEPLPQFAPIITDLLDRGLPPRLTIHHLSIDLADICGKMLQENLVRDLLVFGDTVTVRGSVNVPALNITIICRHLVALPYKGAYPTLNVKWQRPDNFVLKYEQVIQLPTFLMIATP